jgi:serine/alanine adding enzyme
MTAGTLRPATQEAPIAVAAPEMIVHGRPADDQQCDAYVRAHPAGNAYHLSAWHRIVESSFGHQTFRLTAQDEAGAVTGVLPLVRLKSRLFGDFMVSMPYVNYGGPCANDNAARAALLGEAMQLAQASGVRHLEIRGIAPETVHGLQSRSTKVSMHLALPPTPEELSQRFTSKLRSQIKRSQQEEAAVAFGGKDQLDGFYEVFAENMRDLGTPVYAKKFFASILSEMPESARICVVSLRGQPVAAGFLIGFKGIVEIPWASSLRRFSKMSPNMLLYWSVLKYACEQGYQTFDFGRSSPDSGTFKFKAQWGASPVPLHWSYWLPDGGALPELSPQNPKFQLAIKVWQRLPVPVTKIIGPSIVKNLP